MLRNLQETHDTVIPRLIYPAPLEPGSQAAVGLTSTAMGDLAGISGAVSFLLSLCLHFTWFCNLCDCDVLSCAMNENLELIAKASKCCIPVRPGLRAELQLAHGCTIEATSNSHRGGAVRCARHPDTAQKLACQFLHASQSQKNITTELVQQGG